MVHPARPCEGVAKRDTVAAKGTLKRRSLFRNPGKGALLYMVMYVRETARMLERPGRFASLRSGQGQCPCAAVRLSQFQGGNTIQVNKTKLEHDAAAAENKICQLTHQVERIERRAKYLEVGERKKRNHRLITRGAAVESVAPAVKGMSEGEFYELAERIFDLPEVKAILPKAGE